MPDKKKTLSPITVLMMIIVLAAIASWLMPAGRYDKLSNKENDHFVLTTEKGNLDLPFTQKSLDSLHVLIHLEKFRNGSIQKPVSVPGSYHRVAQNREGLTGILQAPVRGIYEAVDIFLFILLLGSFINIFQESGALISGLSLLSYRMRGKESWLIVILTFLFSFGGSSYGMQEEALIFYPVITPIFIAAGYDLIIPAAVIYGGTQLGYLSSITNPFSVILASNAAGVNWIEGIAGRIIMFILSTSCYTWFIIRYTKKIKKNLLASDLYGQHLTETVLPVHISSGISEKPAFTPRTRILLLLFLTSFLIMIAGVVLWNWWFLEMSTLILTATIIFGIVIRMNEKKFMEKFIQGAESMLSVAFIVGVARGITIILNEGNISDSILYYAANGVGHLPPVFFILLVLCLYLLLAIFISSSSAMAVLTMPILGGLAVIIGIPGREIVNSYLYGMGIMGFLAPTGILLPSLALSNVSYAAWWRFIRPFLIFLLILCSTFLIIGLKLK
ncbi:MAG TPA: hypothetical protein VFE04_03260 [Puia sp.]|nr:hypothetical protein [Puia sp.]